MPSHIERIEQFIDYKGVSKQHFDKKISKSLGYIGKQIANSSAVGGDVLEKIAEVYPDINPSWLLTGEGDMLKKPGGQSLDELLKVKDEEVRVLKKVLSAKEQLIAQIEKSNKYKDEEIATLKAKLNQ